MTYFLLGLLYTLFLLAGLAVRHQRKVQFDASDLMLAHRRLPLWIACLTLAATWIGGGYINGTAEAVYDSDQGLVWCQAPWAYALSLVFGGLVFAGPMRQRGYRTMLDLFHDRHGWRVSGVLFVPAVIGDLFWTAAILSALGGTLGALFGVDASLAIVLSAAVVIVYTVWGGLWSVAISDVLQLACIAVGLAITVPFVIEACGGFATMSSEYHAAFGDRAHLIPAGQAWVGPDPWGWQWLDSALLLICGGIPWQVYFQRVLACRSTRAARSMSVLAGAICAAVAVAPVLIGMSGVSLDWQSIAADPPETSAMVLPHVLRFAIPTGVSLIGLFALVAAVMSSTDSSILSSATMFAWNVYRPLRGIPDSSVEIQRVLRFGIVAVGAIAVAMALTVQSVYQLWYLSSDLVYVILFPQLVTALFLSRTTPAGAVAGIVVGMGMRIVMALLTSDRFAVALGWQDVSERLHYVPWRTGAMLASLVTIVLVSSVTKPYAPK